MINIPIIETTNLFKYFSTIICKSVDINKLCILSIVQLSFNKLKLIINNIFSYNIENIILFKY